ncbi:type II toxin-antitoxin system prevent-host-death family antitoxin [Pseudoroseomonas oryzae]|uniref:Type II toxin-antitoxin system prevent-host-death family antitoxin n=2 Tax=Teichococcus oryzae TaxID=1608942 RepID=A0A5B2T991_9PROT|nr:type II toxin-antitoxin system prevent-host-death family antitoxin [Pseudoroseomonas oryzae]
MPMPSPDQATPRRVGVREFRNHLAEFLQQARQGQSFVITSRDQVLAEIHPPARPVAARRAGALKHRIRIAADFDTLPPDILDAMEGKAP